MISFSVSLSRLPSNTTGLFGFGCMSCFSDAVCSVFCLSGTGEGVSLSQAQKASNTNKEYNNFFIGRHFYGLCAANLLKRNEEGKGNCGKMLMS